MKTLKIGNLIFQSYKFQFVFLQRNYCTLCPRLWGLILLLNNQLTKDVPQEALFQPNNPWIWNKKDTNPYILKQLDNIKLSRSQFIATFIINHGPYMGNMFSIENFHHTFVTKFINETSSKHPSEISKDVFMPKHNQILMDRYCDTTYLIRQLSKQHQKHDHELY